MFSGFHADGPQFLDELSNNNTKDWFHANKSRFKESLETPAKDFVAQMIDALGEGWKGKIFRIYRDLRFSKDKTPYNTHLRIGFFKDREAGLFFSLEPDELILGAGVFDFGKEGLVRFRDAVASDKDGKRLENLLNTHLESGYRLDEAELKKVPRGYDKEHERSVLLRRKSLALWRDSKMPKWIFGKSAVDRCLGVFEELDDLRSWLRGVL